MAFKAASHTSILALVAPLLIAAPLARKFGKTVPAISPRIGLSAIAGAVALALGLTFTHAGPPEHNAPQAAITAVRAVTNGPILNDYQFGGYLIAVGIAPSIDSRADFYGGPFVMRHYRALYGKEAELLRGFIAEHQIEATLLLPSTPAVALLDKMPEWRRINSDPAAVAHVRRP